MRVDSISTHAPSDAIIVPDAHLLFTGDFKRSGVDLILSGNDRELVLQDYFKGEKRAALASPDGAHLTGDIVNALTGYTQFAQADGSASVAPAVIGHVTKLAGNATAIRNGVSIILNQGDTVHKGDVVQSGSDSTLGITFIDGTVFGLASNAKMVLNEMIYDPSGSDNKSLLSLVQGTISFVAGATAKKGDMKVDTPVATMGIRGTAVLVEIDFEVPSQGGSPPAKFQVLVEPDGTTGSYILYDKATLTPIATVNRAGTQTIINGQGGVSFQSSVQLSPDAQKIITDVFSLKFSDLNNPNTKLTTNFTDSIVPETFFVKIANGDFVPVTIQLVNVPNPTPPPPDSGPGDRIVHIPGPPQAAAFGGAVTERVDVTASPTLDSVSGIVNYVDINAGDVPSVSAQFSSFAYQNAQQADVTATLTAEQLAAIQAVEVPLVVVQDANGKNIGTATWTYNIADGAFDFLAVGETLTLTYMARVDNNYAPNNETTFVPFTIVITGTNDKPTITSTGGEITERIGTGNTAVDTVTGTVTFTDVDLTDRPVVSAEISATDPFRYYDAQGNDVTATLTAAQLAAILAVQVPLTVVQAAGNSHNGSATWTYSIADSAFDFIADDETLTLNYVAKVDDGHGGVISTPITVSIHGADVVVIGTNDVPTIATTSAAFAELSNVNPPNPTGSTVLHTASGTISFTDVDLTDRPVASAAFTSYTYQNAAHANLTLTAGQLDAVDATLTVVQAAGNTHNGSADWTYSAPDSAFDFLADGEILTLTYTATVNDGHGGIVTKPITIAVTGSNDTAVITSGPQTGTITEIAGAHDLQTLDTATGTITFTDVDWTDTHAVTIVNSVGVSGVATGLANGTVQLTWLSLGSLADSTNGTIGSRGWTFSAPDQYFDYLADSETVTLTYTVRIDDHHGGVTSQNIAVTVTGKNDAPTVVTTNGAFAEMAGTGNDTLDHAGGSITFADLDLSDRPVVSAAFTGYSYQAADGITDLSLTTQQEDDLGVALTLTPAGGNTNNGSVGWSYDVLDNQFDFLAEDETLTLTYTATVNDHHGGLVTKPITVTIAGANDAPTLASETAGKVSDTAGDDSFGDLTGTLAGNDVDHDETASLSYAALDGSSAVNTAVAGLYGSLTVNAGGTYTYVPNAAAINALHEGTYTDMFTVQTTDVHGAVGTAILTIDVNGANDAPTLTAKIAGKLTDTATDNSFANLAGALNGNDRDSSETATLSYAVVDAQDQVTNAAVTGDYGSLMVNEDGTYSYVANAAAINALHEGTYTDTFTVQTVDENGATSSATLTVDVTGANDAPTLANVDAGTIYDTSAADSFENLTGMLTGSDRDYDETGTLQYAALDAEGNAVNELVAGLYGSLKVNADGSYVYVPNAAAIDALPEGDYTDTFTVKTVDVHGAIGTATLTVKVEGVEDARSNQAPVLSAESIRVVENGDAAVTTTVFDIKLSDDDQDSNVTIRASALHGELSSVDDDDGDVLEINGNVSQINAKFAGGIIYAPTDYNGDDKLNDIVTVTATDAHGRSDTLNFVFQQSGWGGAALEGTLGKDVIFATEGNDTLTGRAGADQFVFAPEYGYDPSTDTITDFTQGQDHIDLRAFSQFVDAENIAGWLENPDHVTTSDGDKLIHLDGGDTIILQGRAAATLTANDFIVSPHH